MPHQDNFLLARLSFADMHAITPALKIVELQQGRVLAESHQRIEKVYFPHAGILSLVVTLEDGAGIETGMVGHDGVFGAAQALDDKVSLNKAVIQVSGAASVMDASVLRRFADNMPGFRTLMVQFELFSSAQAQQTAACNAAHDVISRICKWLLRMHELVGEDLPLTQEFLAGMMGVRRTSVTGVASALQKAGLISYKRGHIRIEDIDGVKATACECHGALQSHFEKIFRSAMPLMRCGPLR
jgi:CRP-like cAMP-binding protein